ncbi:hypothetical protein NEF87_000269 [Candidatus Lokiarchaeum ossiferum]|uniref:Uncharacterized protein n=1 Tax=Candidatus Lokiarchaeum ossiferum TaxID=2951803 RepID=A0ABY6HN29_9ARCH|nr:hypothetical protein NEF87_000269 [Candidatus Lokiarchaeum sp. B-35]
MGRILDATSYYLELVDTVNFKQLISVALLTFDLLEKITS